MTVTAMLITERPSSPAAAATPQPLLQHAVLADALPGRRWYRLDPDGLLSPL